MSDRWGRYVLADCHVGADGRIRLCQNTDNVIASLAKQSREH